MVSINALHMEVPILVGKVVPLSVPMMTSSVWLMFGLNLSVSRASSLTGSSSIVVMFIYTRR